MFYWLLYLILWLPVRLIYPTKVIGRKNLQKTRSIWACNHQTLLDPAIIGLYGNCKLYALGKKELFSTKCKAWFYRHIGTIKVDRGTADIAAVKQVLTVLKVKNKPVLVFPTGTRMKDVGEITELKNGVALFALKSKSPIIPMVFLNKPKAFHLTKIVVGEPLDLSRYYEQKPDRELLSQISAELSQKMEQLLQNNQ